MSLKMITGGALGVLVLFIGSCSLFGVDVIEPGNTGIKISKIGSERGVSKENIISGMVFYFRPTTKIVEYPTFNQRVVWTRETTEGSATNEEITAQSKDNIPFSFDMAVNYTLNPIKVPEFYTQFRCDDIKMFTHGYLRDNARSIANAVASELTFDEINGIKKEFFISEITKRVSVLVAPLGVQVADNGVSVIGALRPPEQLKSAINARAQAIQDSIKAENELRTYVANAKKAVAEAEGKAAANKALASSLNSTLMEWERLQIEKQRIAKWNGVYPTTMLSGGANPMFMLK